MFAGVSLLWMTSAWHRLDVTFVAMLGLAVLLTTGTMPWQAAVTERAAWDVFVWYGGLLKMGELLNAHRHDQGVRRERRARSSPACRGW